MTGSATLRRPALGRVLRVAVVAALSCVLLWHGAEPAAAAAKINGSGSTYVALAMQQWVADAQSRGLSVNYLPTGSPDGLTSYANTLTDFAGTEAEFSALSAGGNDPGLGRGYQYVPDVAGAIAVMYNVDDKAGRAVNYLHLSRETIAKIFMGVISNWSDPAISADNKGLVLPNQPITVVYRAGQSGTTALFYDFVQHVDPGDFSSWAAHNSLPTSIRIVQLDSSPNFAPKTLALTGSDQIAQYLASANGKWAIAYDEFGYAKVYGAQTAWVQNQSGAYVQPFAENISAALTGATLRPDLSQELSGVYTNPDPLAYPISAYSYITTQCAPAPDRATCKGQYANTGVTQTLQQWLRYIACDGQVNMARIGYSPLPPNLSQEIANSIARMTGAVPEQLNQGNCANPRFAGNLGAGSGSPPDPLQGVTSIGPGAGGVGNGNSGSSGNTGTATTLPCATTTTTAPAGGASDTTTTTRSATSTTTKAAAGSTTSTSSTTTTAPCGGVGTTATGDNTLNSVGGGSTDVRSASPVAYNRPGIPGTSSSPLLVFLALLALPPIVVGVVRLRRREG